MASNGMSPSPSSFFPPNFLLHMQQTLTPDDPQEHQHHHHEHHLLPPAPPPPPPPPPPPHGHHYHNPSPFLASPQCPSSLQDFRGMAPVVGKRAAMYGGGGGEEEAEVSDEGGGENWKKRRLSVEQVRTLEKNFEVGNKLEPERKAQLARALGLQPRQVAIWFQNRRARWKTKQLEKDYDALSRRLDDLKAHNHALLSHNNKLQAEIAALKGRDAASELINLNKETEASCSNRSENSSEINLDISRTPPPSDSPLDAPPPPPHQGGGGMIPFYPSVARGPGAGAGVDIDQLLHSSAVPKMEHAGGNVQAADTASFGNLLCGVDEPPPFWPWADHQHFH